MSEAVPILALADEIKMIRFKNFRKCRKPVPMVAWLRDCPRDPRVSSLIPETTDFLTNSYGQTTNAYMCLYSPSSINWY